MPFNRSLLVFGLTVITSLSLMGLPEAHKYAVAARCQTGLLTAAQWFFSRAIHYARNEQKTRFLLTQNVKLALKNMRLREAAWENVRLRKALGFKARRFAGQVIPAEVIGRDPDHIYDAITINAGQDRGIEKGWPVVTAEGLVGHVSLVGRRSSEVELMMRSPVSALVQERRAQGIVYWVRGNRFRLRFVEASSAIQKGDRVVSSGLGGRYPKGIPIGILVEVHARGRDPLFQEVYLESSVDFLDLEEVFVIQPWE